MDYPPPRKGELLYFYSTREAAHDATLKAFRNPVFQLLTLIVAGRKENHASSPLELKISCSRHTQTTAYDVALISVRNIVFHLLTLIVAGLTKSRRIIHLRAENIILLMNTLFPRNHPRTLGPHISTHHCHSPNP